MPIPVATHASSRDLDPGPQTAGEGKECLKWFVVIFSTLLGGRGGERVRTENRLAPIDTKGTRHQDQTKKKDTSDRFIIGPLKRSTHTRTPSGRTANVDGPCQVPLTRYY